MASASERNAISRLLKDTIVQFCRTTGLYGGGPVSIDGIVCLSGGREGQEVVVKLHENVSYESKYSEINGRSHPADEAQDLRKKRRLEDSAYDDGSPEYSEMSMEEEGRSFNGGGPIIIAPDNDTRSSLSPESRFIGTSMFNAGMPYFFPKRALMKHDRWSPNQPIPSIPECKQCAFTFDSFDLLQEHNEAMHSVFTCQNCFKTFTSRSNLERHSRLHTGHKPYSCSICGKAFSRKDHLSNHATKHAYKCGTCSKRFSDKKLLVTHYQFDHNAVLTNICDFCNKGFSSTESYEEHVKIHPQYAEGGGSPSSPSMQASSPCPQLNMQKKNYPCSKCSFSSLDALTLAKHAVIHTDNGQHTCLACAKTFDDPLNYCDHLLVHQNEVNIFECVICHQLCSTLQSLRRHEANHVSEESDELHDYGPPAAASTPRYSCFTCNKSFNSQMQLNDHMELHLDLNLPEKQPPQFACPVCNDDFESQTALMLHMEQEKHTQQTSDARSNKRKQHRPKPLQQRVPELPVEREEEEEEEEELREEAMEEEEDYEIVEPESPDEELRPLEIDEHKTDENCNKVSADRERAVLPPPVDSVRSLLFGRAQVEMELQHKALRGPSPVQPSASPSPTPTPTPTATPATPSRLANVEIPPGPYSCSVCQNVSQNFQDLEMHCFSEHNRSPCMFCSKTFAQKANRDRHVCLHTGEKPYSCPECDEKFSRGDKLKLHRTRVHKVQFPAYNVKKEATEVKEEGGENKAVSLWGKEGGGSEDSWPVSLSGKSADLTAYSGGHWSTNGSVAPMDSMFSAASESVYQGGELARVASPRS